MRRTPMIVIEDHADGFVALPAGLEGVLVGQDDTYEEALADVKSAIRFHAETFGPQMLVGRLSTSGTLRRRDGSGCMSPTFRAGVPAERVIGALGKLGFFHIREAQHACMLRENPDGPSTPITNPNHRLIKASTLRSLCTQARITRDEFLAACEDS